MIGMRIPVFLFLIHSLALNGGFAQERSYSSTVDGGRGLLLMQSARTYGQGHLVLGLRGISTEREYPLVNSPGMTVGAEDYPTVFTAPLTYGLTNEIDLTAALFGFRDARPFIDTHDLLLGYDSPGQGVGASFLGVKIRLPFSPQSRVQIAGRIGGYMDTSREELDGLNYSWTRLGTTIESSVYESFDLTSFLSVHLEQGYAISGSRLYDDQVLGGAGLQLNIRNRLALNMEVRNRTFLGISPQSVYRDLVVAGRASSREPGEPPFLRDSHADFNEDYFVFAPSASVRLNRHLAFDFGAVFNLADQASPKERYQVMAGITLRADVRSMLDSDGDGVANNRDQEGRTPKGFPVDARGVAADTDADGVPDGRDRQPDTPKGARVSVLGVGVDADGDGVYDGLDLESQSPAGSPVDRFGIALDEDRDGIPDNMDREPGSRAGSVVDRNGVALDSDGDGIPNGVDIEPDSPRGAKVDLLGASLDGDGDGVPDGLDEEAASPKGVLVDRRGRALVKQENSLLGEGFIRLNSLRFEASSVLPDPQSYPLLDEIGRLLVKYPTLVIQIEGHTDDQGDPEVNYRLSRDRAKAVLEYLLKRFPDLRREQFRVIGFGSDKPLVPNTTPENRRENRRVDFVVINRNELMRLNADK